MKSSAQSPEDYIQALPAERAGVIEKIHQLILGNLPEGFECQMSYGMIGYVVAHSIYPAGYHCNPKLPLPFMNLASQKNYISLYHSGLYSDSGLLQWFTGEYPKHCSTKLDMGKCCVRFKNMDAIPYALIGELVQRITPQQWIRMYEQRLA